MPNTINLTIHHTPPPKHLYDKLRNTFGKSVDFEKGTIFTYGSDVYTKVPLTKDLYEHELVHVYQQTQFNGGRDAWWDLYLKSPEFRLKQEVEAYAVQYSEARKETKDRNKLYKYLYYISSLLAGEMYGKIITQKEAAFEIERLSFMLKS